MHNTMKQMKKHDATNEAQSKHNLERMHTLSDGLDEQIYVIDPETHEILFANKKVREMYGEEILGKKCYKTFQKQDEPCTFCNNKQVFGTNPGKPCVREIQNKRDKRWYRCFDKAIKWSNGKYVHYGIAIDITERKEMEEERKHFEKRLSALNMYGQNLNMARTLEEIYAMTQNAMEKTLGFEHASILMVEGKMLCSMRTRGYSKNLSLKLPLDGDKGITVRAARTGKPIFILDVRKEKAYVRGRPGMLSELAVPIKVGDKVLGVLNVESERLAAFDENDRELLEILASHAATAITNLKRHKLLSALNDYGKKLNMAEKNEVYALTLNAMEKKLGFEFATFFIAEERKLRLVAHRGYPKKLNVVLRLDGKEGVSTRAARTGKPIFILDVRKEKAYVRGRPGMLSELAVPIKVGDKVLGVLNVESERLAAFDENDRELLEILASHAATAITNLKRLEEIEKRSTQFASLMKSSAEMIQSTDLRKRLKTIAEAVSELGWRRVVISLRDENLNTIDLVTAGVTFEEEQYLKEHQSPGHVWRQRLGSMFERFRLGEAYYLPWSDPIVQQQFKYALTSKIPQEEMVDWNPDDLLFIPLRLPDGQVVGIMSIDDPEDGRRPTRESLAPLELFAHQAAVAIENAQSIHQLDKAKEQVREYAEHLEEKVKERTSELRKSEEKLRSIFAASLDAITVTDVDGHVIECNEHALKMHEYSSKNEMIGKSVFDLIAKRDRQRAVENMMKTLKEGMIENMEYTFLTGNGREFPAESSASAIKDTSGKPIACVTVSKDITERKRMQQQIIKSERLAAIGEVAGMVGHDLRNPLTGIAGATYYLKKKVGSKTNKKNIEMLELIEKDIQYSNKIINDLLDYSRDIRLDLTESNPRSIVKEALSLIEIPKNVQVVDMTEGKPRMKIDVERMKRTFANIIKNAIDAMPRGGKLTIKSEKTLDRIRYDFSDTGTGMSKNTIEMLWTPLFTTKARGMGFGLPICKRLVEAHGGSIFVKSTPKKGTTFTVIVPIEPRTEEGGEEIWMKPLESS